MQEDLTATIPSKEFTRRGFLVTSLGVGFALAVQPIAGQTVITTDSEGLVAGEVTIPVKDGEIPAYRAMPAVRDNYPIVLVVQEIFGVHEYIKDICRRFAKTGHTAIAPALYARQADVSKMETNQIISEVVSKVPDEQVMSDLDATAAFAAKNACGDARKIAITGFCWGGRIVWLYAAHNPRVKAGAAWYGRLAANPAAPKNPLQPTMPVDIAAKLTVPVLGLYGAKDQGIPQESVEAMRTELKKGRSKSDIIVYPNSGHGFHADYRDSYNPTDAKDAWSKLNSWFKKHGAA